MLIKLLKNYLKKYLPYFINIIVKHKRNIKINIFINKIFFF